MLLVKDQADTSKEIEIIQRNKAVSKEINDAVMSNEQIEEQLTKIKSYVSLSEVEANKQSLWAGTRYLEYFGEDKPFGTVMGMGIHHSNASHIQDLYYGGNTKLVDLTPSEIDGFNDGAQQFIAQYLQCIRT
jgi:hypothetical protein